MSVRRRHPRAKKATARAFAALGAATCLISLTRVASADDAQELDAAKRRFDDAQYEDAVRLFSVMLDPTKPFCAKEGSTAGQCRLSDPDFIERSRALDGASLVFLKRLPEADQQFEKVLRQNPAYTPNPAIFPPIVTDEFSSVKARLKPELERIFNGKIEQERLTKLARQTHDEADKKWIEDVEILASEEHVVEKNSRIVALIPFGVGQFQNHDYGYGAAFLIGEVLAGTTSIVSAVIGAHYIASADQTPTGGQVVDKTQLGTDINTAQAVNIASFATFATLGVMGILQAQIAFVPEHSTTRTRIIPSRPKPFIVPTVSIVPGGAGLGVRGSF